MERTADTDTDGIKGCTTTDKDGIR